MNSPILFIIFNRPETTARAFETIRAARPPRLYVAADGPRLHKPGEKEKSELARRMATAVDWPCEVKTLFKSENLGCKRAVSSALDWFFQNEEFGIILEDDIVPEGSFFSYCDELLLRYMDNEKVMAISGCNFIQNTYQPEFDYYFSRYCQIWGWASWRRAWKLNDVNMADWPLAKKSSSFTATFGRDLFLRKYWMDQFQATYEGRIDTWDYQWIYTCFKNQGLIATPKYNQIRNIGFGEGATHTQGAEPEYLKLSPPRPLAFPISHPSAILRDQQADLLTDRTSVGLNFIGRLKLVLRPFLKPLKRKLTAWSVRNVH